MSNPLADTPPEAADLACPLCAYSLRGLTTPRCPECGFAFTWAELLDERRDRHRYLYEHAARGPRRRRAFWATYFRTCRPRRFWRDVTPANPVRRGLLVRYWAVASLLLAGVVIGPLVVDGAQLAGEFARARMAATSAKLVRPGPFAPRGARSYFTVPPSPQQLDAEYPPVLSTPFARDAADAYLQHTGGAFVAVAVVAAGWPWLTFATLMIFQVSMRRARTDAGHVLRAAVYGCDFGLLMTAAAVAIYGLTADGGGFGRPRGSQVVELAATLAVLTAAGCAAVTTYRLTVAYARYLRFHLPLATVLASQVIAFLALLAVAVNVAQAW